jgi:hypothetical protein
MRIDDVVALLEVTGDGRQLDQVVACFCVLYC